MGRGAAVFFSLLLAISACFFADCAKSARSSSPSSHVAPGGASRG